ncbi:MAG: heme lyase CcmF/NrfE family subunit, partial [Henriciella sp.]
SEGIGFNPQLQDPGLAIHPPTLNLGYVWLTIADTFSDADLIEGKVDAAWARWVRPWVLAAWCFLTIGITLGSLWAYYELGWGGWWFWDPVENASFMPWLVATALLHSALVVERRHTLVNWTLLLSIVGFTFSLIGTFLVRSGVLTSVHAFAVDPARGVFILAMILVAAGGALTLFAMRAGQIAKGPQFALVSREGSLLFNNVLLMCAAATVFLGTFYPLIIDVLSAEKISVGPPYFNMTFLPLMAVLTLVMAVGPMVRWRADTLKSAVRPLAIAGAGAAAVTLLTLVFGKAVLGAIGFGLAAWLAFSLLVWLARKSDLHMRDWNRSMRRLKALPMASWGFLTGHMGFAVAIAGISGMSVWQSETTASMQVGDRAALGAYELTLADRSMIEGANFDAERLTFAVFRNGKADGEISTERRYYPERDTVTTEAGVRPGLFGNLYVAGSRVEGQTGYSVRINHHPLVGWIWTGGFLVALGGFVSLADRRLRVGAPHRVRQSAALAGAAAR